MREKDAGSGISGRSLRWLWVCRLCLCLWMAVFGCGTLHALAEDAVIDDSTASEGYCQVSWTAGGSSRIKVLVKGPGGTSYQYNLNTGGSYEVFPLTDGNGQYTVSVYKNVSGDKYSTSSSKSFSVSLVSEFAPFLHPNQYVNYSGGSASTARANQLCGGADEMTKIGNIYHYVVENLHYDQGKASSVQSGYVPNVDQTLASGTGICFDYASLTAAMLRSQGIPTKLIVGYAGSAYHAWINVWSNSEGWVDSGIHFNGNEWKLMDPTFASSSNSSSSIMQYIGDGTNYSMKYQY